MERFRNKITNTVQTAKAFEEIPHIALIPGIQQCPKHGLQPFQLGLTSPATVSVLNKRPLVLAIGCLVVHRMSRQKTR